MDKVKNTFKIEEREQERFEKRLQEKGFFTEGIWPMKDIYKKGDGLKGSLLGYIVPRHDPIHVYTIDMPNNPLEKMIEDYMAE